jgi:hypothetical protein
LSVIDAEQPAPRALGPQFATWVRVLCAAVLTGALAGALWLWWAQPATWAVTQESITLDEGGSRSQFAVVVNFIAIGCVVSLLWGALVARKEPAWGWVVVPVTVAATLVAAVVAWRIGVDFGPGSVESQLPAKPGSTVTSPLKVDSVAPFLAWPIAGLVAVVATVALSGRRERTSPE